MDANFHSLPPLKRFRLLQQQEQNQQQLHHSQPKIEPKPPHSSPSNLPAKKRLRSRDLFSQSNESNEKENIPPNTLTPPTPTPYCLPAKKRIWAILPELSPIHSPPRSTRFDLNLEYDPSVELEKETKQEEEKITPVEIQPENGCIKAVEEKKTTQVDIGPEDDCIKEDEEEKTAQVEIKPKDDSVREDEEGKTIEVENKPKDDSVREDEEEKMTQVEIEAKDDFVKENEEGKSIQVKTEPEDDCIKWDAEEITTQVEIEPEDDFIREDEEEVEEDDGILCAVCESTDGDPSDPIVFCDGCDLMVHSTCYGNPLTKGIPEGEWFCSRCSNSQPSGQKCCLCPSIGGAMKPTTDGRWAHIVCALLVPEVFFEDPEGRDRIDCSRVPKRRWRERCYLCKERNKGCAVECSEQKCPLAFHVTCGLKEDLCIELKEEKNTGGIVAGFCKKHTLLWKKQKQTGKFKIVARDEESKV